MRTTESNNGGDPAMDYSIPFSGEQNGLLEQTQPLTNKVLIISRNNQADGNLTLNTGCRKNKKK